MELRDALWALESGYCLWVGAGLTRQAAAGRAAVPLWEELTRELESAAGIEPDPAHDFPSRLDRCRDALGERRFRGTLRERYYTQLCEAVVSQAAELVDVEDVVPANARAIAALGQLANPVVSFNIEPLSSLLLARAAGPLRILFQQPRGAPAHTWRELGGRFQRIVYHPHGIATGATVMTSTDYEANRQTLAFRLALHAAFGNDLVVVGMSLNDEYLRGQIEEFRSSVGGIYWFDSHFPDRVVRWAADCAVTTVRVEWTEFWAEWKRLPVEIDRQDLAVAWHMAVAQAVDELEGGAVRSLGRGLLHEVRPGSAADGLEKLAAELGASGRRAGEPGTSRLVGGEEPRSVELALRRRLSEAGVALPQVSQTYHPGVSPSDVA